MSYQVLARKWRPRNFESLVGQEHVVRALTHALEQQRIHHAYLFTGTRGVGKTTLARILSKSLNCETGITAKPCGQCSACQEIDAGRFVDLLEVDAATNTKVDEMRQLLENAVYAPTRGRFKVYVIDEVHMLSTSAFNAMLKTLEEPPEHIKFILATTDPQKIPVTVLSRCLQFNLKQMPAGSIVAHLERVLAEEKISAELGALKLVAAGAHGSMRDALSLLDQAIAYSSGNVTEESVRTMLGTVDDGFLFEILEAVQTSDAKAALDCAARMESLALSFDAALQDLASLLHQIALAQSNENAIANAEVNKPRILALAKAMDAEEIQLFYQIAIHGRQDLPLAPDGYAGFTMALLRMLAFCPGASGSEGNRPRESVAGSASAAPRQTDVATEAAARTNTPARLDDWPAFVKGLKLGGLAGQLASQSAMVSFADNHLKLKIAPATKHLAEKTTQEKLRLALQETLGASLRLSVEVGATGGGSAQDKAVASIGEDALVRGLIEQFDATIVESSIKPVQ